MKYLIFVLSLSVFSANAKTNVNECISVKGDVGKAMLISMVEDFGIEKKSVIEEKTKVKIIREIPVSFKLAQTYGLKEKKLSGDNSDDSTTVNEYAHGFMHDNSKNNIIEYTFESNKNKKNIFLASAFISDTYCIVRFNGYILVKREF